MMEAEVMQKEDGNEDDIKLRTENLADSSNLLVPSPKPLTQIVDGVQLSVVFPAESFRSALQYKPRSDDIFLVTHPKCGTIWTRYILLLILRYGEPLESQMQTMSMSPCLELTGAEAAEKMLRPGVIVSHLPYHLTPRSDKAKYIYVIRNPKDCCVSLFHHFKSFPCFEFNGTFDEFFEFFMSGKVGYGDYFDHLLEWYEHRNDPNVLFLTYEEIKENHQEAVLKMASFIDEKLYAEPLRNDPQKLQNVVKYSSFDNMKKVINQGLEDIFKMSNEEIMETNLPMELKNIFLNMLPPPPGTASEPRKCNFVRKGIVGDWRNYFSEEQSKRLNKKFLERTKDTEIPNFWMKYM